MAQLQYLPSWAGQAQPSATDGPALSFAAPVTIDDPFSPLLTATANSNEEVTLFASPQTDNAPATVTTTYDLAPEVIAPLEAAQLPPISPNAFAPPETPEPIPATRSVAGSDAKRPGPLLWLMVALLGLALLSACAYTLTEFGAF